METINVADAKSRFSELISRATSGERFIIQRRERPVACADRSGGAGAIGTHLPRRVSAGSGARARRSHLG